MRRSTAVILAIMMIAFGAIMAAGNSALRPLAQDVKASKVLTRQLLARGDIEEGSKVRLSRLPASERRMAEEGRGIVIQMTPSAEVRKRKGGLRLLALRAAREGIGRFPGQSLDWVEIGFEIRKPDGGTEELRALLDASDGEGVTEPRPRLPATLVLAPHS